MFDVSAAKPAKTKALQVRVTDDERETLKKAAKEAGLTQSDFVRLAIKLALAEGVTKEERDYWADFDRKMSRQY